MYLRVARGTSDPSRLDDVVTVLRDVGHPIMRQQPGFQNSSIGINRATGIMNMAGFRTWRGSGTWIRLSGKSRTSGANTSAARNRSSSSIARRAVYPPNDQPATPTRSESISPPRSASSVSFNVNTVSRTEIASVGRRCAAATK
jgi:hypothetical protein